MCGIVGIVSQRPVADQIVAALKRLEYRGYDSAGIATLEAGHLMRRRAQGKLARLEEVLGSMPLAGHIGIGHTRWATHGKPTEANAHPHATDVVAVVHNGIIENFRELKAELEDEGYRLESETDTEVVAHLVTRSIKQGMDELEAVISVLPRLRGAFALVFLFEGQEGLLIGTRRGSPLAVGHGEQDMFFGSDALALSPFTDTITFLEEGDIALIREGEARFMDETGRPVRRRSQRVELGSLKAEKGKFPHFMAKEIHEQPEALARTLAAHVDFGAGVLRPGDAQVIDWKKLTRVTISACGTAYLAGVVAKYWFERFARLPVEIDVASEFRYREAPMPEAGLMLLVSQSGETADTLACLRYAKERNQQVASVVNVTSSTIARESDLVFPTIAGPEIGVASTKAFTCQLAALLTLAVHAGLERGTVSVQEASHLVSLLAQLPGLVRMALLQEPRIKRVASRIASAGTVIYLGRGTCYPLALEGALKLKEITYIHAEGFAAGELKHGPIALIDANVPIIVLAPDDAVMEKTVSNVQEVAARGGRIVLIGEENVQAIAGVPTMASITMPRVDPALAPIVYAVPLQLLAYHTARVLGRDVDQPRNLAKSVTVE